LRIDHADADAHKTKQARISLLAQITAYARIVKLYTQLLGSPEPELEGILSVPPPLLIGIVHAPTALHEHEPHAHKQPLVKRVSPGIVPSGSAIDCSSGVQWRQGQGAQQA
ncbi:hypothetical protein C0992_003465, partial [Termitomyces sp. T32_za158]